jgi:hypothetical protein
VTNITTTDPTILEELTKKATEEPKVEIKTVPPSNSEVTLPGGFINRDGALVKYAEVRELTGLDEEAISKAGSVSRALLVMLQRGLVSIGTESANKEDLDRLLSGDRDAILVGIRKVTFGPEVEFNISCPSCRTSLDVDVDLNTDVPHRFLEDPIEDRSFTYDSKKHGLIEVSLPTGSTQRKLMENTDKTVAELNTILLAGCIDSINGQPSMGASSVLKLGMADREKIINEVVKRNPGPRLGEVKTTCEACGLDIPMSLSLADLFRL